jgi:hypothetical protein
LRCLIDLKRLELDRCKIQKNSSPFDSCNKSPASVFNNSLKISFFAGRGTEMLSH